MARPPAKLLDRARYRIRLKGYSIRTEQSYVSWIRRFILFHNKRHPQDMRKDEIEAFLTHLAVNRHVAPSTQNQAFNALLFLYRNVLEIEFPENINAYSYGSGTAGTQGCEHHHDLHACVEQRRKCCSQPIGQK